MERGAALFVGIDVGGSGTRAAAADAEGRVLAIGKGPGGPVVNGAAARRQLGRALDAALAPIAALARAARCVVHAGSRGLSVPGRRESLLIELSLRFPA